MSCNNDKLDAITVVVDIETIWYQFSHKLVSHDLYDPTPTCESTAEFGLSISQGFPASTSIFGTNMDFFPLESVEQYVQSFAKANGSSCI